MATAATLTVTARLRGQWAWPFLRVASLLGWRRMGLWAISRYHFDVRTGRGPWQPIGRLRGYVDGDTVRVEFVDR